MTGISERMGKAGARVAEADAEALWADIQRLAAGVPWNDDEPFAVNNSMLASTIIRISEHEHWSILRTAMALAYAHMVLSNDHFKDLLEMQSYMQRPIIMNRHCANCNCTDKSTKVDNG